MELTSMQVNDKSAVFENETFHNNFVVFVLFPQTKAEFLKFANVGVFIANYYVPYFCCENMR